MKTILSKYLNYQKLDEFVKLLENKKQIQLKNAKTSARCFFIASAFLKSKKPFLIVLSDKEEAVYFYNDLQSIIPDSQVLFLPATIHRLSHNSGNKIDKASVIMRTETLWKIQKNVVPIIVTYPEAVAETVVTKKSIIDNSLELKTNQSINITDFITQLKNMGFTKTDFVYEPGQFSMRGGIVDVFSFSAEYPFRFDFFGNEIESIRTFDLDSQLSIDKFDKVSIVSNIQIKGKDERFSLLQFIDNKSVVFSDDINYFLEKLKMLYEKETEVEIENPKTEQKEIVEYTNFENFKNDISKYKIVHLSSSNVLNDLPYIDLQINAHPKIQKNFNILSEVLNKKQEEGYETYVFSNSEKQIERLRDILQSNEVKEKSTFLPLNGIVHEGFSDNDLKISIFTDHQIFDRFHGYYLKNYNVEKSKEAQLLNEIKELKVGDYIVHIDYGIGVFKGLVVIENDGKKQEVVRIEYADSDTVFVNIHGLHKISKYKSSEAEPPKVSKLGTSAWNTLKSKAKKRVKDIAKDLIELYARRMQEKGFAFSPDSFLQEALEAAFIYEETPDQLKAISDVKEDMEQQIPMDRLVCGDVGFGKTEIAIRAAYKATADNKQVAILCPTTVLAYQHFRTFLDRLKNTPVSVDFLTRMKSTKEQKKILEKLAEGSLDIIIGTHRIVSKDVVFKDLGLLIIDEEQKFGVSVKERLKQMRVNVDTLTLTATPIPRTLQFSLMGARDLSILQTPPPNRQPIITELHTFNSDIIKKAVNYEIKRGGQVFFVHNHIETLPKIKKMLNDILPEISVEVIHGRMKPADVEDAITRFMQADFDVLLTTSIVENGLDIPNANTIIINNAHKFGLSDLHQLRGRVGRSSRKAFCYLIAPPKTSINDNARRRLNAIENFVELGSGFNIAMQDLDIRGAGDMLGAEQSGFINDIGYETFKRILEEAMLELRTTEYKHIFAQKELDALEKEEDFVFVNDCQITTDLDIGFSESFVTNDAERLKLYRQLDAITEPEKLIVFEKQIEDRFGKIPHQAFELINVVRLRIMAVRLGIEKIVLKNKTLICYFVADKNSVFYDTDIFKVRILNYVMKNQNCEFKEKNDKLYLRFNNVTSIKNVIELIEKI